MAGRIGNASPLSRIRVPRFSCPEHTELTEANAPPRPPPVLGGLPMALLDLCWCDGDDRGRAVSHGRIKGFRFSNVN
jgi:hypothetical protein